MDELIDVKERAESMIKSGHYPASTGGYRLQALEFLTSVLMPEEPRTAQYVLDNLDAITDRWATKTKKSGSTPKTYRSRVKGLLEDYIAWKANPSGFKVDRSAPPRRLHKEKVIETQPEVGAAEPGKGIGQRSTTARLHSYPLPGRNRTIEYGIAIDDDAEPLSVDDVLRFSCSLITQAEDFDMSNAEHSAIFQAAQRESVRRKALPSGNS